MHSNSLSPPQVAKILPVPPTDRSPRFFDLSLSPSWVLFPKISKIVPHFSLNFDYFLAQNCRKFYFMFKITKVYSDFAGGGAFLGSADNFFQVIPHLTLSPTQVSPSGSIPDGDRKSSPKASPPHQKFCEKKNSGCHCVTKWHDSPF